MSEQVYVNSALFASKPAPTVFGQNQHQLTNFHTNKNAPGLSTGGVFLRLIKN
jgi:hypothetical protein